ncbi:MAG: MFS transporter, partial [Burkholderiaceae bacterium]
MPRAVGLGAIAFNLARAIGPALAGGVAAWIGSGSALVPSSACSMLMIFAATRMRKRKRERGLPGVPETVFSGALSGLRITRHSLAMRTMMIRNVTHAGEGRRQGHRLHARGLLQGHLLADGPPVGDLS